MSFFVSGGAIAASRHFGASETDLFSIGYTGQMAVSSVTGAGEWSQPLPISPFNSLVPGACVVASAQFGTGVAQTDVFTVDVSGVLNVFFSTYPGSSWRQLPIPSSVSLVPGAAIASSPQFASGATVPNRTDVFVVASDGSIQVFFVDEGNAWQNKPVSAPRTAIPGGFLAASPQFAANNQTNTTEVFLVDANGSLQGFSAGDANPWQPIRLSEDGLFAPGSFVAASKQFGAGSSGDDQTDVFVIDNNGDLNVFYIYGSHKTWQPQKINNDGTNIPGGAIAVCQQFINGSNQTDVFVANRSGKLDVYFVISAGQWNRITIGDSGIAGPLTKLAASQQFGSPTTANSNQTDLFFVDTNSSLNVFYVLNRGNWSRFVLPEQAPLPLGGLGSGRNIVLTNGFREIVGLQVDILVTETMVPSTTDAMGGIGFQLNCYSAVGENIVWQQYVIQLPPTAATRGAGIEMERQQLD